jgi:F0F1-type ATP synthase alpha subunit
VRKTRTQRQFCISNLKLVIDRVDTVVYNQGEENENAKTVLYFVDKEKRLVLNATNNETLCKAYGNDDNGWIGKQIGLTTKEYTAEGFPPGWIVAALDVEFESDIPF